MASVKQFYEATKQLLIHVEKPMPKEEREEYIEKLQQLLALRDELIQAFQGPAKSSEELKMAEEIVAWNKQINERLSGNLSIIKVEMNKLKKQKDTGKRYENPYQHDPIDGMFIDKKK